MPDLARETLAYQEELARRTVLFLDILRARANGMLDHEQAGLPPLLAFEYETLLDARRFRHPANYALLRVTACGGDLAKHCERPGSRPVIVVDPRAGHGPGIGGFKQDSEVGIALHDGHPTYFVVFYPEPCPGQTLADVLHALRRFVDEVAERHPGTAPAVYGNCQAGWAVAMLAATHEGLAGPAVLNGSPLSYWAGASDVNPMRLAGGLLGGTWLAHFVSDLGNGRFDGAWLAQNFEWLNPANTLWDKQYKVFADVDGERERFLDFEKWWGGFHFLGREEIVAIVENLFIGNRLEQGRLRICEACEADLKSIHNPLVIFASSGDNISPPQQALNWIPAVYPTTRALKRAGQRIVYLLNPHVGHLGIFVSASVARHEHRAILENLDDIEKLQPGLYEMMILGATGDPDCRNRQYRVSFEPRRVKDIRFDYPRAAFERVRDISERNEDAYRTWLSPWVRAAANPIAAQAQKWMHPMRVSRYALSERLNPWMAWVAPTAALMPAPAAHAGENRWMRIERVLAAQVSRALDEWRKARDTWCEDTFAVLYGAPLRGASRARNAPTLGLVDVLDANQRTASRPSYARLSTHSSRKDHETNSPHCHAGARRVRLAGDRGRHRDEGKAHRDGHYRRRAQGRRQDHAG